MKFRVLLCLSPPPPLPLEPKVPKTVRRGGGALVAEIYSKKSQKPEALKGEGFRV